ncbi:MAG TPA: hypothetical protein PLB85_04745 [Candidatus Syntrophosphaera sp.]|nr:hypothetical protein [Candidatus Syntrophosphaera sp.]
MKIHTDVTTLSKLYPIFQEAGIEGMLTGDLEKIRGYGYPELFAALLQTGGIPEVCALITRSETCVQPASKEKKPWDQCSREETMAVILAFFFSLIGLQAESQHLMNALQTALRQISS